MLGCKVKLFQFHPAISLDNLVPKNNFYRHVEAKLDLSFLRDLGKECYSTSMGRPSIDPVVFFKLQLIMFFEGIRSERQLIANVSYNHPFNAPLEHALNIDVVKEAQGPGARVEVELSAEAGRSLVEAILAVLDRAEAGGLLE